MFHETVVYAEDDAGCAHWQVASDGPSQLRTQLGDDLVTEDDRVFVTDGETLLMERLSVRRKCACRVRCWGLGGHFAVGFCSALESIADASLTEGTAGVPTSAHDPLTDCSVAALHTTNPRDRKSTRLNSSHV